MAYLIEIGKCIAVVPVDVKSTFGRGRPRSSHAQLVIDGGIEGSRRSRNRAVMYIKPGVDDTRTL